MLGCEKNMKTRIISAIIMCLIAVPLLLIGGLPFKIFIVVLGVMSMYEIMNIRKKKKEIPIGIRILSYILIATFVYLGTNVYSSNYEIIYKIITVIFLIYFIPVVFINDTEKYNATDALYVLGSTIFLAIAYNSCVLISNTNISYLIYILLVTIATDTFAYFTGYFIGEHKLCVKISPKKTWEGAIGGSFIATIIATVFYIFIIDSSTNIFLVILITLLLTIVGQIGDLFFSSIKRHFNVKDFSNLIPGHGGILDRFDSVIFVILTYILFMNIL